MSDYVKLAKLAIETYIKEGAIISPSPTLPRSLLTKRSGVFVTIEKKTGSKRILRGCIGTYLPTRKNIATEIIYNAIAAATEDPRFLPIREEELSSLHYTVSLLYPPELVKKANQSLNFTEREFRKIGLDPKKYGIIVKSIPQWLSVEDENSPYLKAGLLLPNLKGINSAEQQFSIACQKGNINPYNEKIIIYRFKTEEYDE